MLPYESNGQFLLSTNKKMNNEKKQNQTKKKNNQSKACNNLEKKISYKEKQYTKHKHSNEKYARLLVRNKKQILIA